MNICRVRILVCAGVLLPFLAALCACQDSMVDPSLTFQAISGPEIEPGQCQVAQVVVGVAGAGADSAQGGTGEAMGTGGRRPVEAPESSPHQEPVRKVRRIPSKSPGLEMRLVDESGVALGEVTIRAYHQHDPGEIRPRETSPEGWIYIPLPDFEDGETGGDLFLWTHWSGASLVAARCSTDSSWVGDRVDLGEVVMAPAPPVVTGTVVHESGFGIEGAWVGIQAVPGLAEELIEVSTRPTLSIEDGAFELPGWLDSDSVELKVSVGGFEQVGATWFRVGEQNAQIVMRKLPERQRPGLSMRLVDAEGEPLRFVRVQVHAAYERGGVDQDLRTDADGRLVVSLHSSSGAASGGAVFLWTLPQMDESLAARVSTLSSWTGKDVEIGEVVLSEPPRIVSGRVVDENGVGLSGVSVELRRDSKTPRSYFDAGTRPATSAEGGAFSLSGWLDQDTVEVYATLDGYQIEDRPSFSVRDPQATIVMRARGVIAGRVLVDEGVPPAVARVRFRPSGSPSVPARSAEFDDLAYFGLFKGETHKNSGRFRAELPAGTYDVWIEGPLHQENLYSRELVEVRAFGETDLGDIDLRGQYFLLSLEVESSDGSGLDTPSVSWSDGAAEVQVPRVPVAPSERRFGGRFGGGAGRFRRPPKRHLRLVFDRQVEEVTVRCDGFESALVRPIPGFQKVVLVPETP